jgi:glycosyltransferase involved in cell wall biosynthesis
MSNVVLELRSKGDSGMVEKNDLHQMRNNGKKNILFIVHDNWIGGVELHVKDLIEELYTDYNCFLLFKEEQSLFLTAYITNETVEFIFSLNEDYEHMVYTRAEYEHIIRTILVGFKIDLIHVHHTLGQTLDIFYEAFKCKIPVAVTLHDFYYLCPTINLLDINLKYCKGILEEQRCLHCMHCKLGYTKITLKEWRNEIQKILAAVSRIFVPNKTVKEIYCEYYGDIDEKISVIEHGVVFEKSAYKPNFNGKGYFNIAFIGNITPHKGSNIAHDLIVDNTDTDIRWHIFGGTNDTKVSQLNRDDLNKYGSYDRNKLVDLLDKHNIHLICILSIWPETYSYTLTESMIAGIPVLVSDLGALGDRVHKTGTGWVVRYDDSSREILDKITEIKEDVHSYNKYVDTVKQYKIKSTAEMCKEYREEYELLVENIVIDKQESDFDINTLVMANQNMRHYLITQKLNLSEMLDTLTENEVLTGQQIGIYIFGTGQGGQALIEHVKECGYYGNVKGFFDNSSAKWGSEFMGIPISAPTKEIIQENDFIIIASHSYAHKMKWQLLNMGIPRERAIYPSKLLRSLLAE